MYRVYFWNTSGKQYVDNTLDHPVTLCKAKSLAKDNASSMPNTYFFVDHRFYDNTVLDYSVSNVNGELLETKA